MPTGNRLTDTTNGFLMTMDQNVDVFAARVLKDEQLKRGFNCVGFSQVASPWCRTVTPRHNTSHHVIPRHTTVPPPSKGSKGHEWALPGALTRDAALCLAGELAVPRLHPKVQRRRRLPSRAELAERAWHRLRRGGLP